MTCPLPLSKIITVMNNTTKEVSQNDSELHDQIKVSCEESRPYGGYEGCWPGDGSGMDDLADYMAFEDQGW